MVSHMAKKFNENLIIKNLKKIIAGNIFCTTRKNPTERERAINYETSSNRINELH